MQFEVTNKHEEREGLVFKKPVYIAHVRITLTDEEFEALQSMAKEKAWKMEPLGTLTYTEKLRQEITLDMFYTRSKKTKAFDQGIRASRPEAREYQIREAQDVASTLKAILEARLSALSTSDEDMAIEI